MRRNLHYDIKSFDDHRFEFDLKVNPVDGELWLLARPKPKYRKDIYPNYFPGAGIICGWSWHRPVHDSKWIRDVVARSKK